MTRVPSMAERGQERAFLLTITADGLLLACFIGVATATGSLSLFGETIRGAILLGIHVHAFRTLRRVHQGGFDTYEFGTGKIDHLIWCLLGLAALVGAWWLAERTVGTIGGEVAVAAPQSLAFAAIANAAGLGVHFLGLKAMERAAGDDASGVFRAQISARQGMMLVSLGLVPAMSAAAIARDPSIAFAFDAAGALIQIELKLLRAFVMLRDGVPGLMDSAAPSDLKRAVMTVVREHVPAGRFRGVRTRRSGSVTEVEVAVAADRGETLGDLARLRSAMAAGLKAQKLRIDLGVVPA